MNSRRFDYTISFNADTEKVKKQLQSLQNQINSLTMQGSKQLFQTPDFSNAINDISKLNVVLKNSIDESGKLNLSNFSKQLNTAGLNAEKLSRSMVQIGPEGKKAFYTLTDAVLNAEVPLKRTNTLLNKFSQTLVNTAKWQISSNIMHDLQSGLQQAYSYAQNLNKSLNEIRIVTGYSTDQMADFAKNANSAAKSLRASTLAYTDAALIYYQQGLTGKEITERTNATIKLSNVTGDTVETVSNQLTAVWNNFADGSKNLEYYVDVMTALGAATASSTDEIATGLEKFAAIAETTGLSYEYATSALATVTATTRQSAEIVGTAFKTLFARIQDLELGKTLEDGTSLGSYSQALATVGINIKEQNGELKEMDQILDEMGSKWATLGKAEQVSLAQTVAGTRQYTQLIALMDNWDFFRQNVNTARGSAGTLEAQAQIYAESWEAASKKVKASAEEIYSSLINDKFFIKLTNFFSDTLNVLDNIIDGVGGLKGILIIVSGILMKTFSKQMTDNFNAFGRNMALAGQGLKNGKTFGEKIKSGWQGITGETALRQNTIEQRRNFAETASYLAADTLDSKIDEIALGDMYAEKYKIQSNFLANAEKISDQAKEQYKYEFSILETLQKQYEKAVAIKEAQEDIILEVITNTPRIGGKGKYKDYTAGQAYYELSNAKQIYSSMNEYFQGVKKSLSIGGDTTQLFQKANNYLNNLSNTLSGREEFDSVNSIKFGYDKITKENFQDFLNALTDQMGNIGRSFNNITNKNLLSEEDLKILDSGSQAAFTEVLKQLGFSQQADKIKGTNWNKTQANFGTTMNAVTMSFMSLSTIVNAAQGAIEAWSDSTKSAAEKLQATISSLTTITFGGTQFISGLKSIGFDKGQIGATALIMAAIQVALIGLSHTIEHIESTRPSQKLKKLTEQHEKNQEAIQKNINAYDELEDSLKNLNDQADGLKDLTKGTTEWYLAIQKSNRELINLLKNYKLLSKENYKIDESGLYSLTSKGEEELKNKVYNISQASMQSDLIETLQYQQSLQDINNQKFAAQNNLVSFSEKGGALNTFTKYLSLSNFTGSGVFGWLMAASAAGDAQSNLEQIKGNFVEKIADTMNKTGASIEEENFEEKMANLGYILDDSQKKYLEQIKASDKAKNALEDFATTVAQTNEVEETYKKQIAESFYKDTGVLESAGEDQKDNLAILLGTAIDTASNKLYEEQYKDKGHGLMQGMKDEEIQEEYRKAMGYLGVTNLKDNKAEYILYNSETITVSDDAARKYLATIAAKQSFETERITNFINSLTSEDSPETRLLLGLMTGQGAGLVRFGEQIDEETYRTLLNQNEKLLESLGTTVEEQIEKAKNIIVNPSQNLEKGLSETAIEKITGLEQKTAKILADQYTKISEQYSQLEADEFFNTVFQMRENLVENAKSKWGEDSEEYKNFLNQLDNIDYSILNSSNSLDELTKQLGNSIEGVESLIKKLKEFDTSSLKEINSFVNNALKAINKISSNEVGDTIDKETYENLPPKLQSYYKLNSQGEYINVAEIPQKLKEESQNQQVKNLLSKASDTVIDKQTQLKTNQENYNKYENLSNQKQISASSIYKDNRYQYNFKTEKDFNTFYDFLEENAGKYKNVLEVLQDGQTKRQKFDSNKYYVTLAPMVESKKTAFDSAIKDFNDYIKNGKESFQRNKGNISKEINTLETDIETAYSNLDFSQINTLSGYRTAENMLNQAVNAGLLDKNQVNSYLETILNQVLTSDPKKYSYIQGQIQAGNWDLNRNREDIISGVEEANAIENGQKFVDTITEMSESLEKVDKNSAEYKTTLQDLATKINSQMGLNLTWKQLDNYPELLDSLKEAAGGSAEAIRKLKVQLLQLANSDLFKSVFSNKLINSYISGEEKLSLGEKVNLSKNDFASYQLLGYKLNYDGKNKEWYLSRKFSDVDFTGSETDTDKLNTEIDKLNSRRSILQSKMEHAYDEARRDMEKQEINLVDQLIAKQQALLAVTTDAAQKESILAEIESLRSERESLELDAIKNKYQEIEQLLKNQKSLYEDLADIKKAQGATDLEQLQSEIEGLNFALTDIILAGKNFEEARAYYENHQNDKHAIEQYQEAIVNLSSAQTAFWKTRESITNEINSILDKSDEKINNYIDGLDHIAEGFKNLNDILKSSTFFLSLDEKILANINKLTKEANKLTLDNNKNILTARIAERKTYQKEIEKLKRDLADPTLAAEERTSTEGYLKTAEEKLQSVEDSIQTTWKDSIDLINSIFEESVNEAIKNFENSVSSYSSLDSLKKAFDFQKEESDQVLDSVTQTYELSKLSRTIAQEIGNKTSLKAQNSLKNLLEEINQIQKDKTQLSEQELKNLQQRYDLRLAEIALEEAQWNKTQMRLQRNANGTWSYTYGSTNEDLIKAQQNLEDKQQEIYKTSSEMVDSMSEKLISALQSYSSGMQDIAKKVASGEMTAEQAEEAYRLNRNYLKQAANYAKQLEKALSYANIDYADTDLAKATGTKTLADLMNNITDAAERLDTDTSDALNNLIFQTRDLFQTVGFEATNTYQIIAQAQVASIEKTKDMNKATEELSDTMDGLNKKIDDFRNMWANMSGYIAKSFETIDQLIERLEKIGKSLAGFGDFDAESIGKDNSNKSKSKIFTSKEYTDTDYYRQAEEALARNDITAAEEAVRKRNEKIDKLKLGEEAKLTVDEIRKGIRKGQKYDTGGYTGNWGSDGKLAVLHEKELVLNKEDTANILNAVNAVRSLSSGILKDIFANSGFLMDLLSGMSSAPSINPNGQLEQNVRIEASFPNVSSKDEIEAAFTDLVNQAAQFASIKNL